MSLAYDQTPTKRVNDIDLAPEEAQRQREDKLARILKTYEEDAMGYAQTEIVQQQIDSLQRYFGQLYGDEEDGRSQLVTREVLEGIEWTRPDLMRVFASGGNVVSLTESSPEDARYAKDAADYLQWIFFDDNPGFENLDDFAFDGLLQRRGYLACYWRDKEYQAPQELTGLQMEQVMQLMAEQQAGKLEIIGQNFDDQDSEVGGVTLQIRRLKSPARAEIVSVAPEDMRLNGRAVSLDEARYVGRVIRMLRGEALRLWPEKHDEIQGFKSAQAGTTGAVRRAEDVRQTRFQDDRNDTWRSKAQGDEASVELEVLEEYCRVDLNDDDYPELIRSFRIGDIILEESEVEENPFWTWTPMRIPHRFMGQGYYELLADLQRQNTVLTRAGFDAVYQSVVNREAYDKNKVSLDTLLATWSGAKVEVDGPPGDAIMPLTGGLPTAQNAWEALKIQQQRIEDRVGASRQTRGLDSDALVGDHSGKALQMLDLNASARKEMVALNMAIGLANGFCKLYRLVCRHQNAPRQAKVGGKYCVFDPRTWDSMLSVKIRAGGLNREHTMMGLQLIGQEQALIIETLGPDNPIVTAKNRYAYEEELCRQVRFDVTPFFTEVPDQPVTDQNGQPVVDPQTGQPQMKPWTPPPKQDPQMAKVQADAQAKGAQMQMDAQAKQQDAQLAKEKAAADVQNQRENNAAQIQLAREKAAAEIQVMREKAAAEIETARQQMQMDAQLAQQKMAQDYELEKMRIAMQERVGKAKAASANDNSEAPSVDTDVNGQ